MSQTYIPWGRVAASTSVALAVFCAPAATKAEPSERLGAWVGFGGDFELQQSCYYAGSITGCSQLLFWRVDGGIRLRIWPEVDASISGMYGWSGVADIATHKMMRAQFGVHKIFPVGSWEPSIGLVAGLAGAFDASTDSQFDDESRFAPLIGVELPLLFRGGRIAAGVVPAVTMIGFGDQRDRSVARAHGVVFWAGLGLRIAYSIVASPSPTRSE